MRVLINKYLERYVQADLLDRIELKIKHDLQFTGLSNPIEEDDYSKDRRKLNIVQVNSYVHRWFVPVLKYIRLYVEVVEGVDGQGKTTYCRNRMENKEGVYAVNTHPSHDGRGKFEINRPFIHNPIEVLYLVKFLDERYFFNQMLPCGLYSTKGAFNKDGVGYINVIWAITSDLLRYLSMSINYIKTENSQFGDRDRFSPTFCLINDRSILSSLVYNQTWDALNSDENVNFFRSCFNSAVKVLKYILFEFASEAKLENGESIEKFVITDHRGEQFNKSSTNPTIPHFIGYFQDLAIKIFKNCGRNLNQYLFGKKFRSIENRFERFATERLTRYFLSRPHHFIRTEYNYDKKFINMYYEIISSFVNEFKVELHTSDENCESCDTLIIIEPIVTLPKFNKEMALNHVMEHCIEAVNPMLNRKEYVEELVNDMEKLHNKYTMYADMNNNFINEVTKRNCGEAIPA